MIDHSNPTAGKGLARDYRIYTYTAPADGLFASSHYLVTREGVVVFDAQLLPEYAAALYEDIRGHTKAPVMKIYITHPHPDHYFGAAELIARTRAELTSSLATARHIEAQGASRRTFWATVFGNRVPATIKVPEFTFSGPQPGGIGGVVLEIKEIGLNESPGSIIAWAPQTRELIAGDLVFNGSHLWMAEGHSDAWVRELEALKAYSPRVVYPGHGPKGGPELIDQNLRYLKFVQQSVARYVRDGAVALSNDQLEAVRRDILAAFPGLANPDFLDLTIPAEFSRQTAIRR